MRHRGKGKEKLALVLAGIIFATAGSLWPAKPVSAYVAGTSLRQYVDTNALPNQDGLFAGYVDKLFGAGGNTAKLYGNLAGSRLTGNTKKMYDILKAGIKKVADGERASTEFTIPVRELLGQLKYTEEELGAALYDPKTQRAVSQERQSEILNQFISQRIITEEELYRLFSSLLADCPYELYWYDKSAEGSFCLSTTDVQVKRDGSNGGCMYFDNAMLTFSFLIDAAYGTYYEADIRKTSAAKKAAANAEEIVSEAFGMSDYQKLVYYKKRICELVSYDHSAAEGRSPGNKNPWQLIYVFDKDSRTNVVCEGYAKAYQYLCDMTEFEDQGLRCYTAYGMMLGGTGEGRHMWNIVHVSGCGNYLADLTNSDEGTIGANGGFFLTGCADGNVADGYSVNVSSRRVSYRYHADMGKIYSAEALTLTGDGSLDEAKMHAHSWEESQTVEATCTAPGKKIYSCAICGRTKAEEIPAIGHAYALSYTWSENDGSCTVALVCKNDSAHKGTGMEASGQGTGDIGTSGGASGQGTGDIGTSGGASGQGTEDIEAPGIGMEASGQENKAVTMDVQDADGNKKYNLKIEPQDLTVGNRLFIYLLDPKTGEYVMVDDKAYTVGEDGSLRILVAAGAGRTYQLINATKADGINQAIVKTVAAKKPSAVIRKGKSVKMGLSDALNMENVKSIAYTSSKKAVAQVSAKGVITAKKAGTATIKAKVTLKNGMAKAVFMKVTVRDSK